MSVIIKVNRENSNINFVGNEEFNIHGNFNNWHKTHFVIDVPITLKKTPLCENKYHLFYVNFCDNSNTFEIHVAKLYANMEEKFDYHFKAESKEQFSLEPKISKVNVTIWLYDVCDRDTKEDDVFLWKCGIKTRIKVPAYINTTVDCPKSLRKMAVNSIDGQPKTKGRSILQGGD